jgi:hypothetical protein
MNKAKEAVAGFLNKDGKHDTTVHEASLTFNYGIATY